jgi:hypothetical protein
VRLLAGRHWFREAIEHAGLSHVHPHFLAISSSLALITVSIPF